MSKSRKSNKIIAGKKVTGFGGVTTGAGSIQQGLDNISQAITTGATQLTTINTTGLTTRLTKPVRAKRSGIIGPYKALWDQLVPLDKNFNIIPKINFDDYKKFIDSIMCCSLGNLGKLKDEILPAAQVTDQCRPNLPRKTAFRDEPHRQSVLDASLLTSSQAYALIRYATEMYVKARFELPVVVQHPLGVDPSLVEYIANSVDAIGSAYNSDCTGTLHARPALTCELIWSYWHEEGMLVQSMIAIARRFQNIRKDRVDPLANLELDPLRPLSNILWGYIQDTQHRLTIPRRTYEYDHHYGLRLFGSAITDFKPADSRSKFIEAFHNLLYKCTLYYKEVDDMTRNADAFPLLNALKEVHLLLAEGMHNQYSDLPLTSRVEMLIEQYILSRQEIWEFLRGRAMVLYDESWMGAVDNMKNLQGWPSTSITYYHDLGAFGEDILLTIRHTPWTKINQTDVASNWADQYRDIIQRYIYSYNVVTGVDLSIDSVEVSRESKIAMPALLIQQKHQREKAYVR